MWGRKNKKQPSDLDPQDMQSKFAVHTMRDDMNATSTSSPVSDAADRATSMDVSKNESPFMAQSSQENIPHTESPFMTSGHADASVDIQDDVKDMTLQKEDFSSSKSSQAPQALPVDTPAITFEEEIKEDVLGGESDSQSQMSHFAVESNDLVAKEEIALDQGDVLEEQNDVSSEEFEAEKPQRSSSHTLMLIIMIVIGIALAASIVFAWFWFSNRAQVDVDLTNENNQENMADNTLPDENTQDIIDIDQQETYSRDLPNYLSLPDAASAVPTFATNIATIDRALKNENVTDPITFLVTDRDQNILSFRAFASMVKLNLPEAALAALGDQFEVYAYRGVGSDETRFGFAVDIRDGDALREALLAGEWNFPEQVQAFFLGVAPENAVPVFTDTVYGPHVIRYMNFDNGTDQSIDYAITRNRLILSTSKEMMRALLDRLFGSSALELNNTPEEEPVEPIEQTGENVEIIAPTGIDAATGEPQV